MPHALCNTKCALTSAEKNTNWASLLREGVRVWAVKSHTKTWASLSKHAIIDSLHIMRSANEMHCDRPQKALFCQANKCISFIKNAVLSRTVGVGALMLFPCRALSHRWLWVGGEGIMWSAGELKRRTEAAAARWIIDRNLCVTLSSTHKTSPCLGLNRQRCAARHLPFVWCSGREQIMRSCTSWHQKENYWRFVFMHVNATLLKMKGSQRCMKELFSVPF